MKKYLVMSALVVSALAQSEAAQAERRCFREFISSTKYFIRCHDVAQQPQSRWSVDQMRRVHFNCTTVSTQFGPRRYCY